MGCTENARLFHVALLASAFNNRFVKRKYQVQICISKMLVSDPSSPKNLHFTVVDSKTLRFFDVKRSPRDIKSRVSSIRLKRASVHSGEFLYNRTSLIEFEYHPLTRDSAGKVFILGTDLIKMGSANYGNP